MTTKKKRNDLDICADILRIARGGALKTHIVYRGNLNFSIVKKYLRNLMDRGLLAFRDPLYYSTDKAATYLSRYEMLKVL